MHAAPVRLPPRCRLPALLAAACAIHVTGPALLAQSAVPAGDPPPRLTLDPAEAAHPHGNDVADLTLEDLMGIEVTSVSKQRQRLVETAAAVSVITQEDIHWSNYQTIAELLRLAPGVLVAQTDAHNWAVGVRGFDSRFTNNLLVMMDGRSVYTPLFAGVYWDSVDYVLPDLERIEVVRGPGAALWGANAVNGVINILTKDARDTQGLLLDSYTGTDGVINSVRYGGRIDDRVYFRVYGKTRNMNDFEMPDGDHAFDGYDQYRTGFRADIALTEQDQLTLQGDLFNGRDGETYNIPSFTPPFDALFNKAFSHNGGNGLARWTHTFSETSDLRVQSYIDNFSHGEIGDAFRTNTFDLDIQHCFALGDRQEIIWGGDYRAQATDAFLYRPTDSTLHPEHDTQIGSLFVQDDFTLVPERFHLIAGTKLEYDTVTPNTAELQPSLRGIWTPDEKNTFWGAVSRAAQTPYLGALDATIIARRGVLPNGTPYQMTQYPSPSMRSVHLMAYEAGYRVQPIKPLSLDLAGFYNTYTHANELVAMPPQFVNGVYEYPILNKDDQEAQTWGLELAAAWRPDDRLALSGSYSYLNVNTFGGLGNRPYTQVDPQNQIKLQAHYSLTKTIDLNSQFYWIDEVAGHGIPAYFRWDLNAAWRFEKHTELSAGVWNLLDDHHPEMLNGMRGFTGNTCEVPRTFFIQLQVRF